MHYLHRPATGIGSLAPSAPPGVQQLNIRYQENNEVPRSEYFLAGTAQEVISAAHPEREFAAIRYPTAGMLIALDPDIPPSRQRVRLRAQGIHSGKLLLDGKLLPSRRNAQQELIRDWLPWPGKHQLQLQDAQGKLLDQVNFEVRGAVESKITKPRKKP